MEIERFRKKSYYRVSQIRQVGPGRYTAVFNGEIYKIEGGRKSGGTNKEWLMEGPKFNRPVDCTSVTDALRCLETL